MNPLCKVCGDPAAGYHFGAFTCEGCKSFFGRACNKSQTIPECKKNNKCVINKNTRTTCKACRLTKCIQVGMSKGGSKFGRRSNWFKINFLLEEKQKATMKMNNLSEQMKSVADTSLFAHASPLFGKFPPHGVPTTNQPSPSSTSSSNSLDLIAPISQYTKLAGSGGKVNQTDPLSLQSNAFFSAAMQYPFHPALFSAIEGFSAYYFNQNMLQQQRTNNNESMSSNDDTDESDDASKAGSPRHSAAEATTDMRIVASPTPSSASSATSVSLSSSSIAVPSSDNQDYPIDLSIKSTSPRQVDFSISSLLKIPTV